MIYHIRLTWSSAICFIQSWQQIWLLQGQKYRRQVHVVIIVSITDACCVLKQLLPLQTSTPAVGCRARCVGCSLSEELPSDKCSISPGSCSKEDKNQFHRFGPRPSQADVTATHLVMLEGWLLCSSDASALLALFLRGFGDTTGMRKVSSNQRYKGWFLQVATQNCSWPWLHAVWRKPCVVWSFLIWSILSFFFGQMQVDILIAEQWN